MPMLVKEQWGTENVLFWHYLMLITRTHSKLLQNLCEPRLMKTRLKLQWILVSDTNKLFKFDFDRQLNPCSNIGPKLLATAIKLQNRKDYSAAVFFLMSSIFSLFSRKAND